MLKRLLLVIICSVFILFSCEMTETQTEYSAAVNENTLDVSCGDLLEHFYTRLSFDESEIATEMIAITRYMGEDTMPDSLSGLIDTNGRIVCPLIYDIATDSSEGYSIVGFNANDTGKEYYDPFGNLLDNRNNIYTFANIKGEECFGYYSDARAFSEGIAFVKGFEDNWCALDKSGTITKLDESISWIEGFKDGMAKFGSKTDNKVGFINRDFEIVIPAVYSSASDFSEGLAAVSINDVYDLIYIDKNGNAVIETDYDYYSVSYNTMRFFKAAIDSYSFHEGLAFLPRYYSETETSDHYIDQSGNTVLDNVCGSNFSHGLAPARDENGNVGFIDKTGSFVIPAQYHSATPFNEYGTAFVYSHEYLPEELYTYEDYYGHYCGCINTKGEIVIPIEYYCDDYMFGFPNTTNGIFKLYKDGYLHFFKSNGVLIGRLEELEGAAEMHKNLNDK